MHKGLTAVGIAVLLSTARTPDRIHENTVSKHWTVGKTGL